MSHYTHLTTFERENILLFRSQRKSISFIAQSLIVVNLLFLVN